MLESDKVILGSYFPDLSSISLPVLVGAAAVEVDGRKLWLDETVQMTNLVQNWHFPSSDGNVLNVSWERYNNYHAAPSINFTASKSLRAPASICLHLRV